MIRYGLHHLALPGFFMGIGVLSTWGMIRGFGEAPPGKEPAPQDVQAAAQDDPDTRQARHPRPVSGKEGEAIRKAAAAYIGARDKGDLKTIMGCWAPDADYVDETGRMSRGRGLIIAQF